MSRASASRQSEGGSFASGPSIFKPWSNQTNDFKIDTCCFVARSWHYWNRARNGWLSVMIMRLSGIGGYGASGLMSQ